MIQLEMYGYGRLIHRHQLILPSVDIPGYGKYPEGSIIAVYSGKQYPVTTFMLVSQDPVAEADHPLAHIHAHITPSI